MTRPWVVSVVTKWPSASRAQVNVRFPSTTIIRRNDVSEVFKFAFGIQLSLGYVSGGHYLWVRSTEHLSTADAGPGNGRSTHGPAGWWRGIRSARTNQFRRS